ncbi:hypothetical protein AG1IA_09188 [Rhizoctonia solani AG-1 IA]|uniref:Uncharacterized protein n=1 Tax=Thanatephorus cucumeris (strain AG1-IA) TaxID=983506 RepID=L8WF46_THACA|nr:hypothetical protein AG1IA_09188 [Rhizoctonia solani AG-1 IA]
MSITYTTPPHTSRYIAFRIAWGLYYNHVIFVYHNRRMAIIA